MLAQYPEKHTSEDDVVNEESAVLTNIKGRKDRSVSNVLLYFFKKCTIRVVSAKFDCNIRKCCNVQSSEPTAIFGYTNVREKGQERFSS